MAVPRWCEADGGLNTVGVGLNRVVGEVVRSSDVSSINMTRQSSD
jgi:hypothetical protein